MSNNYYLNENLLPDKIDGIFNLNKNQFDYWRSKSCKNSSVLINETKNYMFKEGCKKPLINYGDMDNSINF